MRALRYTKAARDDLVSIALYIATQSGSRGIAEAFTARLRQKCEQLACLPGAMGRPRPELHQDIRSFAFGNHVIFFRYRDTIFEVVSILEGHRDIVSSISADQPKR